jgi:hypothetical protein
MRKNEWAAGFQGTAPHRMRPVAAHQIGSTLISCLRLSGPDPTACSVPEVTLPHTDTEGRDTPGQLPGISQFFMTKTASASSVTPCSDPNVKFGVR